METLIYIDEKDKFDASAAANSFASSDLKNRTYINTLGAQLGLKYLVSENIDVKNAYSVHAIKKILEEIDIADINLPNIHLDVRVVFDEKEIFVPKTHFTYDILPDAYLVLKLNSDFSGVEFIGFFEPKLINPNNANSEYYFIELEKLTPASQLKSFIQNFKSNSKNVSSDDIERCEEIIVSMADNDVDLKDKKFLIKQLYNSSELVEKFIEYENFEKLSYKAVSHTDFANIINNNIADDIVSDNIATDEIFATFDEIDGIADENIEMENPEISEDELMNDISEETEENLSDISELPELQEDDENSSEFNIEDLIPEEPILDPANIVEDTLETAAAITAEQFVANAQNVLETIGENIPDFEENNDVDKSIDKVIDTISDETLESIVDVMPDELPNLSEESFENNETLDAEDDSIEEPLTIDFDELIPLQEQTTDDNIVEENFVEELVPLDILPDVETPVNNETQQLTNIEDVVDEKLLEPLVEDAIVSPVEDTFEEIQEIEDNVADSVEEIHEIDDTVENFIENTEEKQDSETFGKNLLENLSLESIDDIAIENISEPQNEDISSLDLFEQIDSILDSANINDNQEENIVEENIETEPVTEDIKDIIEVPEEPIDEITPAENISDSEDLGVTSDNEIEMLFDEPTNQEIESIEEDIEPQPEQQIPGGAIVNYAPVNNRKVIAAAAAVIVVLSATAFFLFNKPKNDEISKTPGENINTPINSENIIEPNTPDIKIPESQQVQQEMKNTAKTPVATGADLSVNKLVWDVPDVLLNNGKMREYLLTAGKSIKLSLSADLLLATEYAYSNQIKISLAMGPDGTIQNANIITTSGSKQIDDIVLRSVKETLNVLKPPIDATNKTNFNLNLIIYI